MGALGLLYNAAPPLLPCRGASRHGAVRKGAGMLSATARDYLQTIYNITMEGDAVVGARLPEKQQAS